LQANVAEDHLGVSRRIPQARDDFRLFPDRCRARLITDLREVADSDFPIKEEVLLIPIRAPLAPVSALPSSPTHQGTWLLVQSLYPDVPKAIGVDHADQPALLRGSMEIS